MATVVKADVSVGHDGELTPILFPARPLCFCAGVHGGYRQSRCSIASAPTASTARTRVLADVLGRNGNLLILRVAMNELGDQGAEASR